MSETAKRTGGPRTRKGKANASQNAVTHGVTALTVAPSERAAYSKHLADVAASLAPVGPLEERLAERVALTLWRLRRLEVWEATAIAAEQHDRTVRALLAGSPASDLLRRDHTKDLAVDAMNLAEVRAEIRRMTGEDAEHYFRDISELESYGADKLAWGKEMAGLSDPPTAAEAAKLSTSAACELGEDFFSALGEMEVPAEKVAAALDIESAEDYEHQELVADPGDIPALWRLVDQEASKHEGADNARSICLIESARHHYNGARLQALAKRTRQLIEQASAEALMLDARKLDKMQRYEAHLERVLYRALHELEAMRDRREGKAAPLARVEVHGRDGDDQ